MARPDRRALGVLDVAAAISAVLLAAGCVAWAASWVDGIAMADGQLLAFHAADDRGNFLTAEREWRHLSTVGIWQRLYAFTKTQDRHDWHGLRFGSGTFSETVYMPSARTPNEYLFGNTAESVSVRYRVVGFPLWPVLLVLAVLPVWRVVSRSRRRRRVERGLCRSCGYDLRATPEDPEAGGALLDRCPECGAADPGRRPAASRDVPADPADPADLEDLEAPTATQ